MDVAASTIAQTLDGILYLSTDFALSLCNRREYGTEDHNRQRYRVRDHVERLYGLLKPW